MKIAYNNSDTPWGQDGVWIEPANDSMIYTDANDAAHMAAANPGDDIDAMRQTLIDSLIMVDLDTLSRLDDQAWAALHGQWEISKKCGWTSDESDALMSAEAARRGMED